MGERAFGPYRLVRQIAVGGMAEIHLAKTKGIAGFEKYCALKMIHPNFAEDDQFIQMLVDEAKIAVQLTHGNIAQTFDLGRVGDTYYITMEYVDGADLYKILRRASEQDLEMPLDVCAFIAKEIASALDHAHRKRDHAGKPLGIVHRDVSPQNVLVSYAGEVKLVDFGIAKATMKVRQTAAGVIKGKYYYMSPEQAWGDPIDHRSDIFSAGIVLYELITGQMLYLEEDLHKLLDMARKADIAPPSKLRKGVPPQLQRIVMHALAKHASDRYQSAADLASDLERFLHAYAPVFTASKVASLMRQVIGDPVQVPRVMDPGGPASWPERPVAEEQGGPSVELRDGVTATHALDISDLIHDRDDIRDENSVIFRVDELGRPRPPSQPPPQLAPVRPAAPRATRAADPLPSLAPRPVGRIPSIVKLRPSAPARPRQKDEETRQLAHKAPAGSDDESGLLTPLGKRVDPAGWDASDTHPGAPDDTDVAQTGDRTLVTSGYMMDVAGEDGVDATLVTGAPQPADDGARDLAPPDPTEDEELPTNDGRGHRIDQVAVDVAGAGDDHRDDDDDGPTMAREVVPRRGRTAAPPPALAAKIHAPAVSELRKPRASRRTPPGGVPNVLQQIVGAQISEAMPVPRPSPPELPAPPLGQFPGATSAPYPSGQSLEIPPGQPYPGAPPHGPAPSQSHYPLVPPQFQSGDLGYPVSPGGRYQFSPYGAPPPHPASLTGQMRLFEVDELPAHYKIGAARRWFGYVVAGVMAVSVAAAATFFIIRTTRDSAPTTGSVRIESVPPGAEVVFDGARRIDKTPLTIDNVPVGTKHEVKVELARHKPYLDTIDVPNAGGEVPVMALLKPVTGKLVVNSQPGGAEIRINDQLRGRTPTTLNDIDMASATAIELRLKDYQPYVQRLAWPASGQIDLDVKLQR